MNQVEFINWTVEGRKEVVVITKSGEVVRGTAWAFDEGNLQVASDDIGIQRIQVEQITDIFSIQTKKIPEL